MNDYTDEQQQDMADAFAVLDFKRYVDKNYVSEALEDLAEMIDSPFKRELLLLLAAKAYEIEADQ